MVKKVVAAVLALAMILSFSVVSFAASSNDSDPTHTMLLRAADDIYFDYDGLNQRSDRVFFKMSDDYYVAYFTSLSKDPKSNYFALSNHFYRYKLVNGKFVFHDKHHDKGALPCVSLAYTYSEKEYSFSDGYKIPANITEKVVSRHLSNIVHTNDLSEIWQTIKPLLPVIIPAVVGFLAFRKGWSFLKGEAASA